MVLKLSSSEVSVIFSDGFFSTDGQKLTPHLKKDVSSVSSVAFLPIPNAEIFFLLHSSLDSVCAHEPVAAVEPPRARDDDYAARPRGHPGRGAAALREGGPGGCARKIKFTNFP